MYIGKAKDMQQSIPEMSTEKRTFIYGLRSAETHCSAPAYARGLEL